MVKKCDCQIVSPGKIADLLASYTKNTIAPPMVANNEARNWERREADSVRNCAVTEGMNGTEAAAIDSRFLPRRRYSAPEIVGTPDATLPASVDVSGNDPVTDRSQRPVSGKCGRV
jgi:hypothetical protein